MRRGALCYAVQRPPPRTLTPRERPASQLTWNDTVEILKSKKSVEGIKLEVDVTLWDIDEWEGQQRCQGIISKWHTAAKETLMVKWTGYDRNQQAPLSELEKNNCKIDRKSVV